jgi:hypothetical protein
MIYARMSCFFVPAMRLRTLSHVRFNLCGSPHEESTECTWVTGLDLNCFPVVHVFVKWCSWDLLVTVRIIVEARELSAATNEGVAKSDDMKPAADLTTWPLSSIAEVFTYNKRAAAMQEDGG